MMVYATPKACSMIAFAARKSLAESFSLSRWTMQISLLLAETTSHKLQKFSLSPGSDHSVFKRWPCPGAVI